MGLYSSTFYLPEHQNVSYNVEEKHQQEDYRIPPQYSFWPAGYKLKALFQIFSGKKPLPLLFAFSPAV